ncbi:hypothetical protein [Planomonospora parontospora]|uniref:hypothetical protein n=1 Tax=Planomonospora parontospora TaxID=58119 RepID=UPI00167151CD|nr:hypothetical protein [Planomonospora parontospora]GGL53729.1 hypothetical protein GCM10014719_63780 [Planomonospora parontospora subsp. antibiotica]GII19622.1 hypothetical protein Ppa05_63480 [Planomonospora parontospora subsp. antibiotica]
MTGGRNGAAITMWVGGPADKIAFYARLDRITDGADAVKTLLATRDRLDLARVAQPSGEFVVLLPQHASPIIAWAAP